jgi:hypothetical protein
LTECRRRPLLDAAPYRRIYFVNADLRLGRKKGRNSRVEGASSFDGRRLPFALAVHTLFQWQYIV